MMECVCGILRLILAGNALRPLEIHKVFLRVRAFFCLKIRSQSALGDPIIACFNFSNLVRFAYWGRFRDLTLIWNRFCPATAWSISMA